MLAFTFAGSAEQRHHLLLHNSLPAKTAVRLEWSHSVCWSSSLQRHEDVCEGVQHRLSRCSMAVLLLLLHSATCCQQAVKNMWLTHTHILCGAADTLAARLQGGSMDCTKRQHGLQQAGLPKSIDVTTEVIPSSTTGRRMSMAALRSGPSVALASSRMSSGTLVRIPPSLWSVATRVWLSAVLKLQPGAMGSPVGVAGVGGEQQQC